MSVLHEQTTADDVVASVRQVKQRLAEEMGYDVTRILEDARRKEQESGLSILRPPPRPKLASVRQRGVT